jgi:mannose-6-phosphate isomerase
MAIEHASVQVVRKPWGRTDLSPWSGVEASHDAVGELWFQRVDKDAPDPVLLLKLLFTNEPLSIQVHPDDAFARSIGLPNGKTEAWYILSAAPDGRVAVGLKRRVTPQKLRASIRDGSIADLVQWRPVSKGDTIFVPAGTIHAIGAGIVLAEIQQYSDATFRMFDYGRHRELNEDNAVAVSEAGPAQAQSQSNPHCLSDVRTLLVASQPFVLERINLPRDSSWALVAAQETWILVLDGHAAIGLAVASVGDAIFVGGDRTSIEVGPNGLSALIAYPGPDPIGSLLQNLGEHSTSVSAPAAFSAPPFTGFVEVRT